MASKFADEMAAVGGFANFVPDLDRFRTSSRTRLRSKHAFVTSAISVQTALNGIPRPGRFIFDGLFLYCCAEFELVCRQLIGEYIEQANRKCAPYRTLPNRIRDWYPQGCAHLLMNLNREKFAHVTQQSVIQSIAGCEARGGTTYTLLPEAFTYHERNLRAAELESICTNRLGIDKLWQRLGRDSDLTTAMGARNAETTEQRARYRLDNEVIKRRNDLIHRGQTYYSASQTDVEACATFLSELIPAFQRVLSVNLDAM